MCKASKVQKYCEGILLIVVMFVVWGMPAKKVDAITTGSISLSYIEQGVEFQIYQIGKIDTKNHIQLFDVYAEYAVDMESKYAASTLEAYIKRDRKEPMYVALTDEEGKVRFDSVASAVYLICGQVSDRGTQRYVPAPTIVVLPEKTQAGNLYDAEVVIKYEIEDISEKKSLEVQIVWDTEDDGERPSQIKVQLVKDGIVQETVILSEWNHWTFRWDDLDPSAVWTITEEVTPDEYQVTIQKDGSQSVIVHHKKKEQEEDDSQGGEEEKPSNPGSEGEKPSKPSGEEEKPSSPGKEENKPSKPEGGGEKPGEKEEKPLKPGDKDGGDIHSSEHEKTDKKENDKSESNVSKLPQTGSEWWQVGVLVCIGFLFLVIGLLCKKKE